MPSSVTDLLNKAGLIWQGVTPWGTRPTVHGPGVYLVSTSPDPDTAHVGGACALSEERLTDLIAIRPEMTVDGSPADVARLVEALMAMCPTGETVLYIGLAGTSVADRVGNYYRTRIGARSPHAGGWPLKMRADLDGLFVHVAPAEDPDGAEETMLRAFMAGVPATVRAGLCHPSLPLPFANLQLTTGLRKRHGIEGAKERRASSRVSAMPAVASGPRPPALPKDSSAMAYSLNVTAPDVAKGQIRITKEPKEALSLPRVKTTVSLILRGEPMSVAWDPRLGPDQERSGLLRIGKEAAVRLLGGPVVLDVERDASGLLVLL